MDKNNKKIKTSPLIEKYIKDMNESISSLYNSPYFKSAIKNKKELQKKVEKIIEEIKPALNKQQAMLKNLNKIKSSIAITEDKEYLSISTFQPKKEYTKEDIDQIIKNTVEEIIEKNSIKLDKYKFPYKLPKETNWENITIKFKDGHNVQIVTKNHVHMADYKEMGFEDSRKLKPNEQWAFLKILSENNGEASWDNKEADNKIKKKKQLLSKGLKNYFQIEKDPFYSYRKEKLYRIKINIIPESGSINNNKLPFDENDLETEDYYKNLIDPPLS